MSRPVWWLLAALIAAPVAAGLVYRLAKGLGFLAPPASKEQEYRRTIVVALYALLLFLPLFVYGAEKGWPRVWILFGVFNGIALVVLGAVAVWSAYRLWKLRHPRQPPAGAGASEASSGEASLSSRTAGR
jgi:uncharacterized membrane protein YedE/YeeE